LRVEFERRDPDADGKISEIAFAGLLRWNEDKYTVLIVFRNAADAFGSVREQNSPDEKARAKEFHGTKAASQ
jgi:hypothetical protein